MTTTRKTLRKTIGLRTGQPFFRKYGTGDLTATSGASTYLVATFLKEGTDFWKGQWVLLPDSDQVFECSSFGTSIVTWLQSASPVPTGGTKFEIWSQWSPYEVHEAINQTLRDTWPFFFQVTESYLVNQTNSGGKYTVSSLTPAPRFLAQVYLETGISSVTGTNNSAPGAQNRLKDTTRTFTTADIGKTVRIFNGTSAGDYRTVSALVDANTIQVSVNFTTTLDTTSEYRLVDETEQTRGWQLLFGWSTDSFTNPATLRFGGESQGDNGYLYRLVYEADYATLSAETDTTSCPTEYLYLASIARLYLNRLSLAPATEVSNWQAMYRAAADSAHAYALQNRFRHLASTYIDDQVAQSRLPGDYPFSG